MKGTASIVATSEPVAKGWFQVATELMKARLTTLVLITTAVGFLMGVQDHLTVGLFFNTLLGTAAVAAGAAMLNQWMERDHDARMLRTQDRPLPSGRVRPETALVLGMASGLLGLVYLWILVNALTAILGLVTLVTYLGVYTPLKVVSTWNTVVGAIPGALPPLMGWTAARGTLELSGWSLFAILACWQLPHFLAIT